MSAKLVIALSLCLLCNLLYAQQHKEELILFNNKRLQTNKIGMLTLGSWALANIGTGIIASRGASGSNKYFHQMNAYWNVVNLALAGFGYYGAANADPASFTLSSSVKEQFGIEKLLLLNAGLDVGYIATGFYLMERAKNATTHTDRLKGFGQSVILQGGFLLLFDTTLYFIHNSHNTLLQQLLANISFTGNSATLVLQF